MLVGLSGPAFTRNPGDDHECDDAEGKRLIAAGYATPIVEIETAAAAPVAETRIHPLDHDGDGRKGGSKRRKKGSE